VHQLKLKVKSPVLDSTILAGGADLCFMFLSQAVQCEVGNQLSFAFTKPPCLPSSDFSRYLFRAGSTLAELTELWD